MNDIPLLRRRFELLACRLLASGATFALTACRSPAPTALRAERFEMVEASGRVRASWRMTDDGSPAFTLYDAEGKPRVLLAAAPSGASEVVVYNAAGASLRLRIEPDGSTPYVASSR
jgi:hypothetical protein